MTKSAAEMLFAAKAIDDKALFAALFAPLELHAAFESKFASSTGKGKDRQTQWVPVCEQSSSRVIDCVGEVLERAVSICAVHGDPKNQGAR